MRATGSDDSTKLIDIKQMDLDEAIVWIDDNEWVEITPKNIRLRKAELRNSFRTVIRDQDKLNSKD
jgi:GTP-binding protein